MAQEEDSQRFSNSSGGGGAGISGGGNRYSKKQKQKKVPQRGLGVAQLEKIRIEEQQKRDPRLKPPNSISLPPNNSSQIGANFSPNLTPPAIPFPPPSSTDLPSPNSLFRKFDFNSVPFSKPLNVGGVEMCWPMGPGLDPVNWSQIWNTEHNIDDGAQSNLPFELANNPICSVPQFLQRSQQFQQPCSSSMVNIQSENSSSGMNFQMEPPSNQIYCGNKCIPMWPEEEKVVGMKRAYPFSIDSPPIPSFPCKFPLPFPSIANPDQPASSINGGTLMIHSGKPVFREGAMISSNGLLEENQQRNRKGNGGRNGDFLCLASTPPSSPRLRENRQVSEFESLRRQGYIEESNGGLGSRGSRQQGFYYFLPMPRTQEGEIGKSDFGSKPQIEEIRESNLDLDLKL